MKREEPRPDEIEENPFLWIVCKTGAPRLIITSFHAVARYCADQMPKKMSLGFLRTLAALLVIVMPRSLTYVLLYPIFRLVFGNLYPAYASYKAVRTKNVKEYVSIFFSILLFSNHHLHPRTNQYCLVFSLFSGEMDDVLDRVRAVHVRGDLHRRLLQLLVSGVLFQTWPFPFLSLNLSKEQAEIERGERRGVPFLPEASIKFRSGFRGGQ